MRFPPEPIAGTYVLDELLGQGGMGRVYAAHHNVTKRKVAVKVLQPHLQADRGMVARLTAEGQAAARVEHPNIVHVLDHGLTSDGQPYIVMDTVAGSPLGALVREHGPFTLSRIRGIATQVLAGLAAVHQHDLVHGDMKSDNLLVSSNHGLDRVTIIDFGLARPSGTRPMFVEEDMLSGTPEYMAPEVLNGGPTTFAADIYAVGVVLYELLTGTTPFGDATTSAIFRDQVHGDIVPPSLRCPERDIPPLFERVILRALEHSPAQRHHDAGLFAAAIDHALPPTLVERTLERRDRPSSPPSTREWPKPTHPPPVGR